LSPREIENSESEENTHTYLYKKPNLGDITIHSEIKMRGRKKYYMYDDCKLLVVT
jgi:hypothetical protein